jgi:hypothetical protein
VVEKFTHFKKKVETQTIKKIKILSFNNGTRLQSNDFNSFFLSKTWYKKGIHNILIPINKMGLVRKNKTFVGVVQSMFSHLQLPMTY